MMTDSVSALPQLVTAISTSVPAPGFDKVIADIAD